MEHRDNNVIIKIDNRLAVKDKRELQMIMTGCAAIINACLTTREYMFISSLLMSMLKHMSSNLGIDLEKRSSDEKWN